MLAKKKKNSPAVFIFKSAHLWSPFKALLTLQFHAGGIHQPSHAPQRLKLASFTVVNATFWDFSAISNKVGP